MRILIFLLMLITLDSTDSLAQFILPPWAHHNKTEYVSGVTSKNPFDGKYAAYIRSREIQGNTMGTLWQAIKPRPDWFGERVMMTGYMKTLKLSGSAGLFMRVSTYGGWINYDYMYDRLVQGDNDWHKYIISLDIPNDTSLIDFGAWITGKGEVQVDGFRFEVVDQKVLTTGTSEKIEFGEPENLGFEGYHQLKREEN